MNPFNWRTGQPSVMAEEGDSLARSRRASEAVARKTAATGRNPGTVPGLSRKTHARDTDTAWSRSNSGVG